MNHSSLSQASDDRLGELLFAGEDVEEEISLDGARVAVTSHRVLAFMPEGGDRRFDHEDRPNVLNASVETTGRDGYLSWATRSTVYGLLMLGGGYMTHSSGLLTELDGANAPNNGAAGGVTEMVELMGGLFAALTDALLLIGSVLLLVAGVLGWLYYTSRSEELVIERAGRDPIRVPMGGEEAEMAAQRIRTTLGTGSKSMND